MIPIRDENPQIKTPIVTYGLIACNVLTWFLIQGYGMGSELNVSICQFGLIPAEVLGLEPSRQLVCPPGGNITFISFVSSMFMHGSWMHILGNMWFLYIFGGNVEDATGSLNFLLFYILSGLAAAGSQILADPVSVIPMVGASGAIGGVMGAYIILYPKVRVQLLIVVYIITTFRVPAVAMLGYWFLVQFMGAFTSSSATGGVAFWAHIGGFVAGLVLIWFFKDEELLARHPHYGWHDGKRKFFGRD